MRISPWLVAMLLLLPYCTPNSPVPESAPKIVPSNRTENQEIGGSQSSSLPTKVRTLTPSAPESAYEIILDGLDEPRGLWLRTDGSLCVAETGRLVERQRAGPKSATLQSNTGALTCLDPEGYQKKVARNLPYVLYGAEGVSVGPTDVAEMDGALYLLMGEGYQRLSRSILLIGGKQPRQIVAKFDNLPGQDSAEQYLDPTIAAANPYAMVPNPANRSFLVTDGATGRVLEAELDGRVRIYAPVEGHQVLTGITWGPKGILYVTSFSQLPHRTGDGAMLSIQSDGTATVIIDNLTTPIDLAFDQAGHLYILEFANGDDSKEPYLNTLGRLLRFRREGDGWGAGQVQVEALPYPTGMVFGQDGSLYLSINGAFSPPGSGAVLRFDKLAHWPETRAPLRYGS